MKTALHIALVTLLLVTYIGIANAEKRVALVIGNFSYQHVQALSNPPQDAKAVADSLSRLSFDVTLQINQTFQAMNKSLRDFARKAARSDMAVVYFAGHGIEIDGQNYLIPIDAELKQDNDVEYETLSLRQVMNSVRGARTLRMVLLDACRNNPFAASMQMTSTTRSIGRGLARIEPSAGTLVSYAAKQGTTADDGHGKNSPYTKALLAHLEEPGLEVQFLFRKVRDQVLKDTNRRQEPFTYGSLPGKRIYLKKPKIGPATATPKTEFLAVELAYWNEIKDSTDPLVIQSYLDRFPEGQFALPAKTRLKRAKTDETAGSKFVSEREGDHYVYVPAGEASRILVVAHSAPGKQQTARANARRYFKRWRRFAEEHKLIVIAPVFDEARFGSKSQGYGGYRGLFGKLIGADMFVNRIVQRYARLTIGKEPRFLLYGHSAGGQFALRYTVRYPDNVLRTVVSAAGRFSYPTKSAPWPYGAGALERSITWDRGKVINLETVEPDLEKYAQAAAKVRLVVGGRDTDPQPKRPGHIGGTRVELARSWSEQMNQFAKQMGRQGDITVTVVPGVGHNSRNLTSTAAKLLLAGGL